VSHRPAIRRWAALAVTLAMVAAGVAGVLAWRADGAKSAATAAAPVQTTTVIRTDLSTSQSLSGTLGYGSPVQVNGSQSGIITWLPTAGGTVTRGQPLYRVDNLPVPLFYGSIPLYRTLNVVGMVGPDVQMIAGNLTALGYDIGYQPPVGSVVTQEAQVTASQAPAAVAAFPEPAAAAKGPSPTASPSRTASPAPSAKPTISRGPTTGSTSPAPTVGASRTARTAAATPSASPSPSPVTNTVEHGDAVFTSSLIDAIKLWQAAVGMRVTGKLGVGDVLVEPGAVQVSSLQVQPGDSAAGALMSVSPTTKEVTVNADSSTIPSLDHAGTVVITLPDNSTTTGIVTSISRTVQSAADTSDNQPQQTVTVALNHPAAAAGLQTASVQVTFRGQSKSGVLAVPVGALLALTGGGYAVQLPGGRLIAVQTGMFAMGLVQVSGTGIVPGLRVVTSA
jgi:hypothetical protein